MKKIRVSALITAAVLLLGGCGKKSNVIDVSGWEGISPPVRATEEDGTEGLYEIDQNLLKQDYKIVFVNTCGRDLEKLNLTFSTAPDSVTEVLGGRKLKDGSIFEFDDALLDKLSNEKSLKLSIKAATKNDEILDFGTTGLLDLSNTTLILDKDKENWVVYCD